MYKLLMDSDALIKISKAGFLERVAENFEVMITKEVYGETVTEGRKGFYEDADKIDNLVKDGKIAIIKGEAYKNKPKPQQSFGLGEASIFQAYKKSRLIVTDDLSFNLYLKKEGIQSISSAHVLLLCFKNKKISKNETHIYLERLRTFIRKETYKNVKIDIGG